MSPRTQSASRAASALRAQLAARGGRVSPTSLIKRAGSLCKKDVEREEPLEDMPKTDGHAGLTSERLRAAVRQPGYRVGAGTVVTLHVYDALWVATADTNIPVVHLGVEVYGNEFFFGESGVRATKPGLYDTSKHRGTLALGRTALGKREVFRMVSNLKQEWPGEAYRLVGHNCQTFALQFCDKLGLGDGSIPSQYVYFAKPILAPLGNTIPMMIVHHSGSNSGSNFCSNSGSKSSGGLSNSKGSNPSRYSNSSGFCCVSSDFEALEAEATLELPDVLTDGVDYI